MLSKLLVDNIDTAGPSDRVIRCGSGAARLLRLRVRIPPVVWICLSCEYCVLSGRGFDLGMFTRPEES